MKELRRDAQNKCRNGSNGSAFKSGCISVTKKNKI